MIKVFTIKWNENLNFFSLQKILTREKGTRFHSRFLSLYNKFLGA